MKDAAIALAMIHWRTNAFPADFTSALRAHLEKLKAAPRLGLWDPFKKGSPPYDITALAAWLDPEDPAYLREMIAARRGGPTGWFWADQKKPPVRPWLADERAAIERLALLDRLTEAEGARLAQLRAEASIVRVPLAELLGEYKDNEVRADAKFKGKVVQVSGIVDDVKKDILGSVYVTVGTGQMFEIPVVQCFLADGEEGKAAQLSKGQQVKMRGRVDGLMMNVLVKDCGVVQ